MAKCKKCNKDIEFVKLNTGKIMPINMNIKLVVVEDEDEFGHGLGRYEVIGGRESHFATCPYANKFRKVKER